MKRILIGVAAVMLVSLMSGPVLAGTQTDAKIALHLKDHPLKGDPCTLDPVTQVIACSNYVVEGDLNTSYDLYLMLAGGVNPPGLAALSCGISYNNNGCGSSNSACLITTLLRRWPRTTPGRAMYWNGSKSPMIWIYLSRLFPFGNRGFISVMCMSTCRLTGIFMVHPLKID